MLFFFFFPKTHLCQMWRGVKSGIENTGGRAAPWLSHGAASSQWLGEVKAPDNISIVEPAALLGCRCFRGRYVCRIFRIIQIVQSKKKKRKKKRSSGNASQVNAHIWTSHSWPLPFWRSVCASSHPPPHVAA